MTATDECILELARADLCIVRFNLKRGGLENLVYLDRMAHRIYELAGWYVELYVDATKLQELRTTLLKLPAVSIDHLGLSLEGFSYLMDLVENGMKAKATGFGRVDFDVQKAIATIYSSQP